MWRIGLTGGIGSGKSTVARMLVQWGAQLIDTDEIAHQLTQPGGAAVPALRSAFGPSMIDDHGALDRAQMRRLAFSDSQAQQALQGILHPLIREQVRACEQAAAQSSGQTWLVIDVPLLVESGGWCQRVDQVWLVDCLESTQVRRVAARPGWTEDAAQAVLERQATRAQRRACADVVLFNDGLSSLEALHANVRLICEGLNAATNASPDTNRGAAR